MLRKLTSSVNFIQAKMLIILSSISYIFDIGARANINAANFIILDLN